MTKKKTTKTAKPLNTKAWVNYSKRLAKWAASVDSGGNPTPPPPPPPGFGKG